MWESDSVVRLVAAGALALAILVGAVVWLWAIDHARQRFVRQLINDIRFWKARDTEHAREKAELIAEATQAQADVRHWRNLAVKRGDQMRRRDKATVVASPEAIRRLRTDPRLSGEIVHLEQLIFDDDDGDDWSDSGLKTQQRPPPLPE